MRRYCVVFVRSCAAATSLRSADAGLAWVRCAPCNAGLPVSRGLHSPVVRVVESARSAGSVSARAEPAMNEAVDQNVKKEYAVGERLGKGTVERGVLAEEVHIHRCIRADTGTRVSRARGTVSEARRRG